VQRKGGSLRIRKRVIIEGMIKMKSRQQNACKAIAAFLVFAIAQVYIQMTFAEPSPAKPVLPLPQQFIARLTTKGNQPITVNGISAANGASIVTGAVVETGADVSATINLGALGTLDIAPNTKLRIDYDDQGNVNVRLITGCVVLYAKKKTAEGEIVTDAGSAGKTERAKGGVIDVCWTNGAALVNQGAAAAAGAGAGAGVAAGTAAGAAAGVGVPLSEAVAVAIFGGGTVAFAIATAAQATSSFGP
jgi:hypothetical protein